MTCDVLRVAIALLAAALLATAFQACPLIMHNLVQAGNILRLAPETMR